MTAGSVIQTGQALSAADCFNDCALIPVCDSVNYRPADKSCQLVSQSVRLTVNSADIVADSDWEWWKTTFIDVV